MAGRHPAQLAGALISRIPYDEQLDRQMAVADTKLREAVARLLREDGVGVLAASLALAGLTAELQRVAAMEPKGRA